MPRTEVAMPAGVGLVPSTVQPTGAFAGAARVPVGEDELGGLARGLANLNQNLQPFLLNRYDEGTADIKRTAAQEAELDARTEENRTKFRKAVNDGTISDAHNPHYIAAMKRQIGSYDAEAYGQALESGMVNQVFSTPEALNKYLTDSRAPFDKAVGTDADMRGAFLEKSAQAEQQFRARQVHRRIQDLEATAEAADEAALSSLVMANVGPTGFTQNAPGAFKAKLDEMMLTKGAFAKGKANLTMHQQVSALAAYMNKPELLSQYIEMAGQKNSGISLAASDKLALVKQRDQMIDQDEDEKYRREIRREAAERRDGQLEMSKLFSEYDARVKTGGKDTADGWMVEQVKKGSAGGLIARLETSQAFSRAATDPRQQAPTTFLYGPANGVGMIDEQLRSGNTPAEVVKSVMGSFKAAHLDANPETLRAVHAAVTNQVNAQGNLEAQAGSDPGAKALNAVYAQSVGNALQTIQGLHLARPKDQREVLRDELRTASLAMNPTLTESSLLYIEQLGLNRWAQSQQLLNEPLVKQANADVVNEARLNQLTEAEVLQREADGLIEPSAALHARAELGKNESARVNIAEQHVARLRDIEARWTRETAAQVGKLEEDRAKELSELSAKEAQLQVLEPGTKLTKEYGEILTKYGTQIRRLQTDRPQQFDQVKWQALREINEDFFNAAPGKDRDAVQRGAGDIIEARLGLQPLPQVDLNRPSPPPPVDVKAQMDKALNVPPVAGGKFKSTLRSTEAAASYRDVQANVWKEASRAEATKRSGPTIEAGRDRAGRSFFATPVLQSIGSNLLSLDNPTLTEEVRSERVKELFRHRDEAFKLWPDVPEHPSTPYITRQLNAGRASAGERPVTVQQLLDALPTGPGKTVPTGADVAAAWSAVTGTDISGFLHTSVRNSVVSLALSQRTRETVRGVVGFSAEELATDAVPIADIFKVPVRADDKSLTAALPAIVKRMGIEPTQEALEELKARLKANRR